MSHRRRFRKQKFIDKKQQLRFAMELALYALLFPLFFLVLSLADPIVNQLMGNDTGKLQPLYSLLSFCIEHWWEFIFALGLVGLISILFSHRIVGPIRRFENALIQKAQHPTEPVKNTVAIVETTFKTDGTFNFTAPVTFVAPHLDTDVDGDNWDIHGYDHPAMDLNDLINDNHSHTTGGDKAGINLIYDSSPQDAQFAKVDLYTDLTITQKGNIEGDESDYGNTFPYLLRSEQFGAGQARFSIRMPARHLE